MSVKTNNRRLILCCLGLLLTARVPAGGEDSPVFADPLRYQRMPWLAAAEAGNRFWEEGDEEGAIREWEKAVELGFTDGIAFFYLGRHYTLHRDWKKAIHFLRSAIPRLEHSEGEERMIPAARELLALAYRQERRYLESYILYLQALRMDPDSPSIHLGMAQLFLLWGKLDDAERSARRVLDLSPEDGQAGRILALIAKQRGNYPEAAEYYRILLAEDPEDWLARLDRGLILAAHLDREREAERELERVVREKPDQDQAHAALGEIYLRRGDDAAAAAAAGRALKINPANTAALSIRGRVRLGEGDLTGAETDFREALRIEPGYALALYGLGIIYFENGEYGEAESHFRQALGRVEAFPEASLNRGLSLEVLGRREEALRVLRELVENHPEFAPGQLGLGRLYFYSGQIDQALPFLRNALALDPSAWEAYYFIGKCLQFRGDTTGALDYFLSARRRGGAAPALLTDLARAYEEAGKFDLAEEALEEALSADADYLPALFQLGLLKGRREQGPEAARLYRQALVIRPGAASWSFAGEERDFFFRMVSGLEEYLGTGIDYLSLFALIRDISRDRKVFAEVIPVLREKVRTHPSRPQYAHLLGLAYQEDDDLANAEKYYRRALDIDSDFTAAHLSLGQLYIRTGRPREARRHLSAVLLLVPDSAFSPEVREMLDNLPE